MKRSRPGGVLAPAFQLQRGAGFGVRLARHRDQHGRGVFHGATQAKPGSQRDAAGRGRWDIAEIEDDETESAALNQQIGSFEGMLGIVGGTNPKQTIEVDTGSAGRCGIESVLGVDKGANFFPMSGLREDGEQKASASGGCRPEDFGEASPRQAAGGRIEIGNTGGNAFRRGTGLPVEMAAEERFELRFECGSRHFAFCSPNLIFTGKDGEVSSQRLRICDDPHRFVASLSHCLYWYADYPDLSGA